MMKKVKKGLTGLLLVLTMCMVSACSSKDMTDESNTDQKDNSNVNSVTDGTYKDDSTTTGDANDNKGAVKDIGDGVVDGVEDVGRGIADGVEEVGDGVENAVDSNGSMGSTTGGASNAANN